VSLQDRRVGVELRFGKGRDLFQRVDHQDFEPHLEASTLVEVTVLAIGDTVLAHLLGEELAQALITGLGVETVPSARVLDVPPPIQALLYASMSFNLSGPLRKLFSQTKVMEYLTSLAKYIIHDLRETPSISALRQRRVQQLRAELMHLEDKIPTLDELALRYRTSARTLNQDFQKIFGQSIFAFVTERRLHLAQILLQDSNIPMKQLADRLGYAHVNHFITAFRQKYGHPPGQYRRTKMKEPA
jgi:AraC-like DNA-binding protein